MIRRVVKVLAVLVGVLVVLAVWGWFVLRPPMLAVPRQGRLVFTNVTVVNPGRDRQTAQTLTVEGDHIATLTATASDTRATENTAQLSGRYVLPGLIDMHVHHMPPDTMLYGLLFLAHGVTTVRDTGDFSGQILQQRRQLQEGGYPGPRLFACGPIIDADPPWWPGSRAVRTEAEARAVVAELAGAGVDCIKVYWRLSGELLAAIRAAATEHHLPVVGHIPLAVPFEQAHLTDIQHLTGVPVFTPDPNSTRTTQFAAWAAAWHGLDDARIDMIVRTSVEQGLLHTPTLVVWAQMGRQREYLTRRDSSAAQLLPRWYREVFWHPRDEFLPAFDDLGHALPQMKMVVRRLYQAGVRMHVGSDTPNPFVVPGAGLQEEMALWVDAGLSPEEVWVAATRWAGETLGVPKLGTVQEGAPADFLLFRDDPTLDLHALSTLEAVVTQGRLYPKSVLDDALRQQQAYFNGWFYDHLSMAYARWIAARMRTDEP